MPLPIRTKQRIIAAQLGIPPWQGVPLAPSGINPVTGATQGNTVNQGNGTPPFQWRYWPVLNQIELVGSLGGPLSSLNGGIGPLNGTLVLGNGAVWRLPFPPAHPAIIGVACQGNTAGPPSGQISIDTTGLMTWSGIPASTVSISFHAFISLDA